MVEPPISVLVVDDEHLARARLLMLLGAAPDVTVTGQCANGFEALDAITAHRPELVSDAATVPTANADCPWRTCVAGHAAAWWRMATSQRPPRTYVAFTCLGGWRHGRPLGTVLASTVTGAREAARQRWPGAGPLLRVRAAAGVPADVLGRALALDGAAGRPPTPVDRDPPDAP